ncbi:MAG TPA: hypothetical protein DHW63_03285, partial [Hyphomonadaceae bacterium]|nr:hypothetical protein [Hyphomonadaceae bacterium]
MKTTTLWRASLALCALTLAACAGQSTQTSSTEDEIIVTGSQTDEARRPARPEQRIPSPDLAAPPAPPPQAMLESFAG